MKKFIDKTVPIAAVTALCFAMLALVSIVLGRLDTFVPLFIGMAFCALVEFIAIAISICSEK